MVNQVVGTKLARDPFFPAFTLDESPQGLINKDTLVGRVKKITSQKDRNTLLNMVDSARKRVANMADAPQLNDAWLCASITVDSELPVPKMGILKSLWNGILNFLGERISSSVIVERISQLRAEIAARVDISTIQPLPDDGIAQAINAERAKLKTMREDTLPELKTQLGALRSEFNAAAKLFFQNGNYFEFANYVTKAASLKQSVKSNNELPQKFKQNLLIALDRFDEFIQMKNDRNLDMQSFKNHLDNCIAVLAKLKLINEDEAFEKLSNPQEEDRLFPQKLMLFYIDVELDLDVQFTKEIGQYAAQDKLLDAQLSNLAKVKEAKKKQDDAKRLAVLQTELKKYSIISPQIEKMITLTDINELKKYAEASIKLIGSDARYSDYFLQIVVIYNLINFRGAAGENGEVEKAFDVMLASFDQDLPSYVALMKMSNNVVGIELTDENKMTYLNDFLQNLQIHYKHLIEKATKEMRALQPQAAAVAPVAVPQVSVPVVAVPWSAAPTKSLTEELLDLKVHLQRKSSTDCTERLQGVKGRCNALPRGTELLNQIYGNLYWIFRDIELVEVEPGMNWGPDTFLGKPHGTISLIDMNEYRALAIDEVLAGKIRTMPKQTF